MQMLYNSESFAVMRIDTHASALPAGQAPGPAGAGERARGGYEIVDKFARKEIFLQGPLAESFKQGVDALIQTEPSGEEIDAYIERFASLMHQPLSLH
ncbi:MAG: DUF3567 domain-containing protein [Burkholderiaceae bacterium]